MLLLVATLLVITSFPGMAGSPGSFAGTVVKGPEPSDTWVYVEGRNHNVRRVYVSGAKISYDADVPDSQRQTPVPQTLPAGIRIRVTADQDQAGEWRATEIKILETSTPTEKKKSAAPTTSQS